MLQFSVETARLKIGQLPKEINEPTSQIYSQSVGRSDGCIVVLGQLVLQLFWSVSRSVCQSVSRNS